MADKTVTDMFADMAKQINLPKIDYDAFLEIHRKNIEATQPSRRLCCRRVGARSSQSNRKS